MSLESARAAGSAAAERYLEYAPGKHEQEYYAQGSTKETGSNVMRVRKMYRSVLGSMAMLSACHLSAGTEVEDATDWAAMIQEVLAEFSTPNGPIVEVVQSVRCDSDRYELPDRPAQQAIEGPPCPGESVRQVLEEFSARANASLVASTSDIPSCRWSQSATGGKKGLRLEVVVQNVPDKDGHISIWVNARCVRDREYPLGGIESAIYSFEHVDGHWERRDEVLMIS